MPDTAPPSAIATIALPSPTATGQLAAALAPRLGPGDTLLLDGPIGAGKSHFARTLIQTRQQAVGLAEDVPSPTFTLVQTYQAGDLEIWHCDLYRLSHPDELLELGLDDAFAGALCLIEWPDRLGGLAPPDALTLRFRTPADDPEARQITAEGPARWNWVAGVFRDVAHG